MNTPNRNLRTAFTLVELLLVIAIILVLTTLALGVMQSAQDDARESATLNRISTIESLLQQELENYEVRRMPISNGELLAYVNEAGNGGTAAGAPVIVRAKNLRRRILAEIIRAEMPTFVETTPGVFGRNLDLGVFPSANHVPLTAVAPFNTTFGDWLATNYPNAPTSGPYAGYPTLATLLTQRTPSRVNYWAQYNFAGTTLLEPGEYLYKILELIDIDGSSGIEMVGPNAIGDNDGDGHLEILDAWGRSMQLRVVQVSTDFGDAGQLTDEATDVYRDTEFTNWDTLDVSTLPLGYEVINPTIPRLITKFRFQIVSPTLQSWNL